MSIRVVGYVMGLQTPSPLGKLLLLYGADGATEDGVLSFDDQQKAAAFCCATADDVMVAVDEMVAANVLLPWADGRFVIQGYEPPPPPPAGKRQLPLSIRRAVIDRDGHKCLACGATNDLSIDHIHPESKGGSHDMSNLQTLCRPCNRRKGVRLP